MKKESSHVFGTRKRGEKSMVGPANHIPLGSLLKIDEYTQLQSNFMVNSS